jgi:hypothetical protein
MTARHDQQRLLAEFEEFKESLRRSHEAGKQESDALPKVVHDFQEPHQDSQAPEQDDGPPFPKQQASDGLERVEVDKANQSIVHDFNLIDLELRGASRHETAPNPPKADGLNAPADADLTASRQLNEEKASMRPISLAGDARKPRRWIKLGLAAALIALAGLGLKFGFWDEPTDSPQSITSSSEAPLSDEDSGAEVATKSEPQQDPSLLDAAPNSPPTTFKSDQVNEALRPAETAPTSDVPSVDGERAAETTNAAPPPPAAREETASPSLASPEKPIEQPAAQDAQIASPPAGRAQEAAKPAASPVRPTRPAAAQAAPPAGERVKAKVLPPKPTDRVRQSPVAKPVDIHPAASEIKPEAEHISAPPPAPPTPHARAPKPSAGSDPIGFMKSTVNSVTGAVADWGRGVIGSWP